MRRMIFAEQVNESEVLVGDEIVRAGAEADTFEQYTAPHSARIAELADALAVRFSFALRDRQMLKKAAFFHDVGELEMNRAYISDPRTLTGPERLDLYRHPVIGEQQAAKRDFPRAVQLMVRWHHEWWNGSGYPDKLKADQIPLAARILRICDTYAALTSERPFRKAFSSREADTYIAEAAGIEFDPRLSLAFLDLPERIVEQPVAEEQEFPAEDPAETE